jgi:hypothetical protein
VGVALCVLWTLCSTGAAAGEDSLPARLGVPLSIRFDVPQGWLTAELTQDSSYAVLEQDGPLVTVVPLLPGTLSVHALKAWSGPDTVSFTIAPVPIEPRFPDTVYNVGPGAFPVDVGLPRGYPEDYLKALRFWEVWGRQPDSCAAWIVGGALLAALLVAAAFYAYRRRQGRATDAPMPRPGGEGLRREILELLDLPSYASADWAEFYRSYEELVRRLVARRTGIADRSLTYRQLRNRLCRSDEGTELYESLSPLFRETEVQRYAGWGSTRDRAARFVRSLAELAEQGEKP